MAKKIRLDFSKVEERSGWNTKHIAEGLYKMKIESVQETEAQDGTDMLVYALVPADPKLKTRRFPFYCKIQQNQLWKLRDLLVAAGQTVPKRAAQIDPSVIVGKYIAAEVEDDSYQGNIRSSVNGTYGLDILDEQDSPAGDDEDDEEEYEADEAEDEEYEEEEEAEDEEEEEEEEDLESLSLVELRKLAKGLGIDTAGLKKADLIESIEEAQAEEGDEDDDDEDLGDEDLEDEELYEDEEEEEEEEPVKPARRAAPARKPAAKAAAAPARRVVKRR
jgi:hypothetical protein